MSGRTLRLLISVAGVFAVFIYLISSSLNSLLPQKNENEGALGGPIPGLTRWQLAKFEEGKALFAKKFTVKEGLGPSYNARSCIDCHGGGSVSGDAGASAADSAYDLFAKRKAESRFSKDNLKTVLDKLESRDIDLMTDEGGPCFLRKSVSDDKEQRAELPGLTPDCKLEAQKNIPEKAELRSHRFAPALFGLGLVDSIADRLFFMQMGRQGQDAKKQQGKVSACPDFFGDGVGRFGRKAQHNSLMNAIASELGVQLGVSNPIYRHSLSPGGIDKIPSCMKSVLPGDPNVDSRILTRLCFYLSCLSPPPRGEITPSVQKGGVVFDKCGCSVCHVPQMRTPEDVALINPDAEEPWEIAELPSGQNNPPLQITREPHFVKIRALECVSFHPFSDFLLHDMGPQLADGIAQGTASGAEWRTAPLWGLRSRHFYLHDGRAKTLQEAITAHGGQGADAARAYGKLSDEDKKLLLAFLNSL